MMGIEADVLCLQGRHCINCTITLVPRIITTFDCRDIPFQSKNHKKQIDSNIKKPLYMSNNNVEIGSLWKSFWKMETRKRMEAELV